MGSGNMNPWLSGWVKESYPDEKGDLCTCFISRGLRFAMMDASVAIITSDTCMYLSSFEKMRKRLIQSHTISCFIDTRGSNAHPDVFDANAGWVIRKGKSAASRGAFIKLNQPIAKKDSALIEAIQDPDCGWFYRADAEEFRAIPGWPISAYWGTESIRALFTALPVFDESLAMREGIHTADNSKYLRCWWEVTQRLVVHGASCLEEIDSRGRWVPYCKGGEYRKWYGNFDYLIGFDSSYRSAMRGLQGCVWPSQSLWFKEGGTWTAVSSGNFGVRWFPNGCLFDAGGQVLIGDNCVEAIAALNSSLYSIIPRCGQK